MVRDICFSFEETAHWEKVTILGRPNTEESGEPQCRTVGQPSKSPAHPAMTFPYNPLPIHASSQQPLVTHTTFLPLHILFSDAYKACFESPQRTGSNISRLTSRDTSSRQPKRVTLRDVPSCKMDANVRKSIRRSCTFLWSTKRPNAAPKELAGLLKFKSWQVMLAFSINGEYRSYICIFRRTHAFMLHTCSKSLQDDELGLLRGYRFKKKQCDQHALKCLPLGPRVCMENWSPIGESRIRDPRWSMSTTPSLPWR